MTIDVRTVYIAEDGREFTNREACHQYEADGCVELSPIPEYGDHQPLTDGVLLWMLSGDGSCYYATAGKRSKIRARRTGHPEWATHILYFGK